MQIVKNKSKKIEKVISMNISMEFPKNHVKIQYGVFAGQF